MDAQDVMIQNQFLRDINPLLCGWENCCPGHSYGPAVRTYWLLHYVTCGYGKVQKGETVFPVAPGSLFIIQPEEVVYFHKIFRIRGNFEQKENWEIEYNPDYKKDLIDEEKEKEKEKEKKKKEQEKKAASKSTQSKPNE